MGMLRFSIFGFPVAVHWMFWLTTALISGRVMAESRDEVLELFCFIAAAFVSIMIHELGHAVMMRRYGARAAIMLYAFGGMAAPDRGFTRGQSNIVSVAGPLIQIALGIFIFFLLRYVPIPNIFLLRFLVDIVVVSIFWGILNLIPIYPLDGGQILYNSLGGNKAKTTYRVGMVLGGVLAILFLLMGNLFGTALFGMMAFENFQRSQGQRSSSFLNPR